VGKNNTNPADFVSSGILVSNLQQGDYTVRVTDTSAPGIGCVATATLPVEFEVTNFSSSLTSVVQVNCAPALDGSITVTNVTETVAGTSTTYSMTNAIDRGRFSFQWFDQNLDPLPVSPTPVNGLNALTNTAAGDYYVMITNSMGCSATLTGAIIDDMTVVPQITLDNFLNPAICVLPETEGYLQVSADNSLNFSDYTFEWFEGADDTGILVEPNNATLGNILYNQPLEYTVRVTNIATNCVSRDTYRFSVDTVKIQVLASAVARTNCLADNGSLFATTLNGTGALYNYEWYAGPTATGTPVYTTKQVTGAPIGEYTVIAVNPNHSFCNSTPYTTRVMDERILPTVVAAQKNPLTYCDPSNPNGVAVASVNNEVNGYTFDWFRGAVGGAPIYTGSEIAGLTATTYVVRATDVLTGCDNTASILIENKPVNVPEPTVVVISHRTNCVDPDGILAVSVNGNTADYLLQWYDGKSVKSQADEVGEFYRELVEGFYATTATDNVSGCVSDPVITEVLPFQEVPEFDIVTVPTNCEQNVGEATLVLKNDVQLYSVEWNIAGDIQFGTMLSDLPKGEFTVIATTYQQCTEEKTFTILPEVLVFNGVSRNNDGHNDYFEIACIQDFPNNNVKIFNRAGTLVYEANGYDNQDVFFDGVSNRGINLLGTDLPDGTYFYIIDKRDGSEPRTGYLELLR
jgi:gliding motility-associated-like protein